MSFKDMFGTKETKKKPELVAPKPSEQEVSDLVIDKVLRLEQQLISLTEGLNKEFDKIYQEIDNVLEKAADQPRFIIRAEGIEKKDKVKKDA